MVRLHRSLVEVSTGKGLKTVEAEVNALCGLGIWREVDKYTKRYNVMHLGSGLKIKDFRTKKQARCFLENIQSITDWTKNQEVILKEYESFRKELYQACAVAETK